MASMEAQAERPQPQAQNGGVAAWYMIAVLLLFYIFSSIDRSVISMMVQPLERDLGVSDFQISLLQGPAFGVFYVLCGLPMGWLVDRISRRWLVAAGVTVWGAATCACGLAGNVAQLFAGRMGVGVGESVLTPAAHSMIAERFPRSRLSFAISVFTMGSVVGAGLALTVGGTVVHLVTHGPPLVLPVLGELKAWQAVFLLVGAPPVILAPLIFTVREHRRRATPQAPAAARPKGEALAFYKRRWPIAIGLPLAFGCTNVASNVMIAWGPTYLIRTFGWNAAEVGLRYGLVVVVAGAIGQLSGGAIVDWMYARGIKDAHVRFHILGLLVSAPALAFGLLSANIVFFFIGMTIFYTASYPYIGYAAAGLQLFTPNSLRGLASAVFLAIITLVGTGLGPTSVALVTEQVFHDKAKLGVSMAICILTAAVVAIVAMLQVGRVMRAADHDEGAAH